MNKFKSFQDFGKAFEAENFDTKLEKNPDQIEKGDQVFSLGKWHTVTEVRNDGFAVTDDHEKVSVIKKSDVLSRGVLVKIPTANESVDKADPEMGSLKWEFWNQARVKINKNDWWIDTLHYGRGSTDLGKIKQAAEMHLDK